MTEPPAGLPDWFEPLLTRVHESDATTWTRLPTPANGRASAVLVLLGETDHDGPDVLILQRAATMRSHAGQPAFPGGASDPGDADAAATALREAQEEVGLPRDHVELIGALQPTPTFVTNYAIYPFVGMIDPGFAWIPQDTEVAEVLELALDDVRAGFGRRRIVRRGMPFRTDTYQVGDHVIWGATARIVADLLDRVEAADPR